jgi:serine/threonine protein kinase
VVLGGVGLLDAVSPPMHDAQRSTVVSVGSPVYQSPEQLLEGAIADEASDIYAFGGIVYEMLTGEPPFGRSAGLLLVRRKLSGAYIPLSEVRSQASPLFDALVRHCLQPVPADRLGGLQMALLVGAPTAIDANGAVRG